MEGLENSQWRQESALRFCTAMTCVVIKVVHCGSNKGRKSSRLVRYTATAKVKSKVQF